MVIVDARSKVATQGNRVMGLGTELVRYYEGIELFYGNIANIHTARDSLSEVQKLCFARDLAGNDADSGGATFWGRLDGTKWLSQGAFYFMCGCEDRRARALRADGRVSAL